MRLQYQSNSCTLVITFPTGIHEVLHITVDAPVISHKSYDRAYETAGAVVTPRHSIQKVILRVMVARAAKATSPVAQYQSVEGLMAGQRSSLKPEI